MKALFLVIAIFALAQTAEAGRRRGNYYSYGGGYNGGGYTDCYDYVRRTGGVGAAVGTYSTMPALKAGDVLHLQNYNWNGMASPNHWVRVDGVNGDTVTVSHSNVGGNHGRVVQYFTASSFRGTVTLHR